MKMADRTTNSPHGQAEPSILLFGSLALSFDDSALAQVRKSVVDNDNNTWLVDVVRQLPQDCERISSELPSLYNSGALACKQLADLQEAFHTGRPLDTTFPLPNALLIPLVVIDQLTQYAAFVRHSNIDRDGGLDDWPTSKNETETLGLCTGILSSFAVSSAHSMNEFRRYGAAAVRLGMLVGLVVDSQDAAFEGGRSRSLSVAWSAERGGEELEEILEDFDEAYVSVYYDEKRSTVTTPAASLLDLVRRLKAAGLGVTELGLYGAFHSARNSALVEQLVAFCDSHSQFQLADATALEMPSWVNGIDGSHVSQGALHVHALRSILEQPPRWFDTFSTALREKGESVSVLSFGPERSVPLSLTSRSNIQVVHAADARDDANRKGGKADRHSDRLWRESDIAVVGMACKVAGADDVEEFWDLLVEGQSQHRDVSTSERFSFADTPFRTAADNKMDRTWFANLVRGHDQFDHRFFKKSARESAAMDPQQRQILQVAYQAAAQGGYFAREARERDGNVGCFVGVCLGDYESNVGCHAANAFTATGNLQGFIAGKVSHFLGWTGPALTIDTACSSSLVAVHQACQSILSGECNAALAGGTHVMTSAAWFQNLAAGSFLSPTGQCKPFDAAADGYCRGEGVGAVLLKKMSQAVADGDQILGVIAATAVQQNQNCTPIFVPNVPSLADLFTTVTAKAHVKPSQISVVEAHGTGTAVGDPAEYDSIRQTLAGPKRTPDTPLMVSSVKGLVGHLECTSGIVSLVKTLLMLNKRMLPPQASFHALNPALNAQPSDHMFIPRRLQPWDVDFRVALINNYGASGSNASMIVMQAPSFAAKEARLVEHVKDCPYPFWLSGLDAHSLRRGATALRRFLARSTISPSPSLTNISFNLAHQSDRALGQSFLFTAASVTELDQRLATLEKGHTSPSATPETNHTVILCFGGQISTYIGLDPHIYNSVALLRKHLDNVDTALQSLGRPSIFPLIFQRTPIADIVRLQTTLFAIQYACARAWIDSGIRPAVLVGHSFGELTALCVSQVLSLQDTLRMIVRRATIVQDAWGSDKGAMMAIEADRNDVEQLLLDANSRHPDKPASIACYNGPRSFTLAGSTSAIDAVDARLRELPTKTAKSKRLNVTNAFHSALVDPLLDRLEQGVQGLTFRKPVIPLERAVEPTSSQTNLSARSVADHMRNPVYFHHALERIARRHASSPCVFLEAGTNSTITAMASRALGNSSVKGTSTFHGLNMANCDDGWNKLTDTTMSLWKADINVQHWAHHGLQRRHQADIEPLLLPPYQFDPNARHWMELKTLPKALPTSTDEAAKNLIEADKQPEELLTFFGFLDGSTQKQARFQINTATEKYKNLLSGHFTIQTAPICPATMQISFVIEAIGSIQPQLRPEHEPQIQDVQYQSPVCANSSRTTWIEVNNDVAGGLEWRFEVFSTENQSKSRMVHTTGKIIFSHASDASVKRQLVHFERLFGHHRAVDLLQSAEVDEVLANRNIYRIFSEIVDYGDEYRGLQKMVAHGNQSAGHVIRKNLDSDQTPRFDAYLADTFCQLGGLWVNCMTDRSPNDVYLANGIDQWIRSPRTAVQPPKEFHVFATHHRPSDKLSLTDVFVFDATDGALVEVILGIAYVKISKPSMQKMLTRLTGPEWLAKVPTESTMLEPISAPKSSSRLEKVNLPSAALQVPTLPPPPANSVVEPKMPNSNDRSLQDDLTMRVKAVIADLSGLEVTEIGDDSDLADLGIDSLAGMEMVHEIETALHVTLPANEILTVVNMRDLMKVVAGALGVDMDANEDDSDNYIPSTTTSLDGAGATTNTTTPSPESDVEKDELEASESSGLKLSHTIVMEAFNETKKLTDECIADVGQAHYVSEVLPLQNELAVLLTFEAFEALGAGFHHARLGERLPRIPYGKEHDHFVNYLYDMLETETQIIKLDGDAITRTAMPLPQRSSAEVYEELLRRFPDQHSADKLTYHAGVNLRQVLSGETTGVKLIFGSSEGRELVSAFYGEWPLNQVLYTQMEDFFTRLTAKLRASQDVISDSKPLRILEMGAGTGGTTRRIVPLLAQLQVPIEYTFTDLAPSFVAAARKKWGKLYPWMRFRAHDIEKAPEDDLVGTQHFVLASNAIHATHSLCESTRNVRKFLRPDGFLLMGEMTRTPYWVDIIFGLFEGWWMFDDGRTHALTHESRWETDLQAVDYGRVDWTEGARPESEIEKLILAAAASSTKLAGPGSVHPVQNATPVSYRLKKSNSIDCAKREELVAKYVRDLTQGFGENLQPHWPSTNSKSPYNPQAKWILITGATGGLGAHLVAEAAMRPDVERVVCLNRRSKQDPLERQNQALRKKGVELAPEALAKLLVYETDLSQPTNLGLSDEQYASLVENVTHIVHNAWLMHSKWTVKRFEPQLRIMAHMLSLAQAISLHRPRSDLVTFLFISSIATVGAHPLLTNSPVVPEQRVPIASVLPTGYGDAKYICERMLDATLHQHTDRFRAATIRLGQIAGSATNAHWNPMEHVPFMIKSSQTLRALPDLPGSLGWTPADAIARSLLDICAQPHAVALHPIYHIDNPVRQPWADVIAVLADALHIPQDTTGIIPLHEWLRRVREWPRAEDNAPDGANPAHLLVDFLEDNFVRMSCGGLLMGTAKARAHSETLAGVGPVGEGLVRAFVAGWREGGFLA
ncbi:putative polyketide synthase [Dothidotthia symphoricarpi CBS 119687]|uniref:Putative polyketide synthase n=1 Tax=Dothidotthia symphoricarpi CBS 119687 TaxID=1392245 RepID=A0A6A6AV64_9PLEO|nr:putative polyketide synthase [Dothidotthia symphoricarpi CBS 119687]KAF2134747.1 putative polyketide synthase [Dothidotthia symphoricarpi CBS 119687]